MLIREAENDEIPQCLRLVGEVFREFVAPDCSPEGVEEFFKFLQPALIARRIADGGFLLGAFDENNRVAGVLMVRDLSHIALLFVAKTHFGQGLAGRLLNEAVKKCREQNPALTALTVFSSPYAEAVYRKLGFHATGEREEKNGIAYIPMTLALEPESRLPQ